jgi:hypothetical protein
MPQLVYKPGDIVPGDLFEDCRYHPCVCYDVGDPPADSVFGISLIDGSTWQCSIVKCRVRKLTPAEAWRWKSEGPPVEDLPPEERWRQQLHAEPGAAPDAARDIGSGSS